MALGMCPEAYSAGCLTSINRGLSVLIFSLRVLDLHHSVIIAWKRSQKIIDRF